MVKSALALILLPVAACASAIGDPPASLGLDPFYTQYLDAEGIPIVASSRVSRAALTDARDMVEGMLAFRPDLAAWLSRNGYRVAIMAESETTTDLPEQAHWTRPAKDDPRLTRCERKHYDERIGAMTDQQYWDSRARGMAGVLTSGAEEDILGKPSSRYYGETIFVHEFSHNVLAAIRAVDPALSGQIDAAYEAAQQADRWHDEYAMTSVDEYWAEGAQFWFNSNRLAVMDGRRVLNADDLKAYDPPLYAALGKAFGDNHRLPADPFWMADARVPPGPIPENTAEVC
ncbi:glycoside hydrolase [Erythrobacter sp. LQ02-29]|uniref:glycoside hydrolase n=1 Tax=Erythrobacter sp. LQ02-29 TaxID=2920384 RepID=UPI001F4E34D4|nr:glycoside hydrolase [Erythrobacter sp. LQ02-29]MCP9223023.1 glycoside hydrolase [Erythrobacter sp. LQ02-29]